MTKIADCLTLKVGGGGGVWGWKHFCSVALYNFQNSGGGGVKPPSPSPFLGPVLTQVCFVQRTIRMRGPSLETFIWQSKNGAQARRSLSESWSNLQQPTMRTRYLPWVTFGSRLFTSPAGIRQRRRGTRTALWPCTNRSWGMTPGICTQPMGWGAFWPIRDFRGRREMFSHR